MNQQSLSERYSRASVALHWLMVLAFVVVYAAINVADLFDKGTAARQFAKNMHFSFGLLVFALVWVRLVFRLQGSTPPIVPAPPVRQEQLGKLVHLALYMLMIAMPLLGWLVLSAGGKPIPFFGLDLPALLAEDKPFGRQLRQVHELGANVGYVLIAGHAAAALFHHYFVKDNTLKRMWFK
jgi:cytochrome b561